MQGIYLALGGNEGDRKANLLRAQKLLAERGIATVKASSLYQNPALLPENAPVDWNIPFLNQVIEVATNHSAEAVLEEIKKVEAVLGRKASPRWSPRPIDIDILAYHDKEFSGQRLSIPHPEWYKRDFVVIPWHEIAPNWHWHGMSLAQLYHTFNAGDVTRYVA